jgi:hypothetical protein
VTLLFNLIKLKFAWPGKHLFLQYFPVSYVSYARALQRLPENSKPGLSMTQIQKRSPIQDKAVGIIAAGPGRWILARQLQLNGVSVKFCEPVFEWGKIYVLRKQKNTVDSRKWRR